MKKIKITQVKSAIDRPERQKLTLRALGLNKMNASRELQASAQVLGMVRAVNHLLKVEEFEVEDSMQNNVALQEVEPVETADSTIELPTDMAETAEPEVVDDQPLEREQAV
ncbi:MAG: 50S ribosomal protein L30 [Chitinophagaceae bacterium]